MADTTRGWKENVKCDDCGEMGTLFTHWGPLTKGELKNLCGKCMKIRVEGKYREQISKLDVEYETSKTAIEREFAYSNSSVVIGDVVSDHLGSIRVEKINWRRATSLNLPSCIYLGQPLKKDGTEMKKKERRSVYQSNLKTAPEQHL